MELGALEKSITAYRDAIETQRIIVPPVLQALHQARLFRSLIPQAVGGLGLDLPEHMRIIPHLYSEGVVFDRNGLKIIAIEVDHGDLLKPAYGYRIDYDNRSVTISGDTRYSENLIKNSLQTPA